MDTFDGRLGLTLESSLKGLSVGIFRRSKGGRQSFGEKTRDTYFLETDQKVIDIAVIGYVESSPHNAVEDTRSYVLPQMQGALRRDQERFVRWWVEDQSGNVIEAHDDFSPPAKPTMQS